MSEYKLCYIDEPWAWFTTQDITKQWGDDWNDAPYEHNAGTPYAFDKYDKERGREPWQLVRVAFETPSYETPCANVSNSRYSVEAINHKHAPWLAPWKPDPKYPPIFAGITLDEFVDAIVASGGTVYTANKDHHL